MQGHFKDDNRINAIPAEENIAYFKLSVKSSLSDKISKTEISFETKFSYSNSSSMQKTISDGVALERVYDTVNEEPGKQLVLAKIHHIL